VSKLEAMIEVINGPRGRCACLCKNYSDYERIRAHNEQDRCQLNLAYGDYVRLGSKAHMPT
jgi:hypothetical protein